MTEPSWLVSVPTVSDPALAPPGRHVLYALEPVPNLDGQIDWTTEELKFHDLDNAAAQEPLFVPRTPDAREGVVLAGHILGKAVYVGLFRRPQ